MHASSTTNKKKMAVTIISKSSKSFVIMLFPLLVLLSYTPNMVLVRSDNTTITQTEKDLFEFALNFAYLECEFFLNGALGYGLDVVAPKLVEGGPPPIGAKRANLGPLVKDLMSQIGYQYTGQLRAKKRIVKGFPRPLLNISSELFAQLMDNAFERPLVPPFDPYVNEINFLLASYVIPYIGVTGLTNANILLETPTAKALLAGILGMESGQDGVIRTLLYEHRARLVDPYKESVEEFTNRISELRNKLGREGLKDEGLVVPKELGAEGKVSGNILSGNNDSLQYGRTAPELLRIVYLTGNESRPGGFFPKGADGVLAKSFLVKYKVHIKI
ncbi:desiccation-related protein PCC13-62-like [Arachis ipaensis]|uniref:desiccation-related protein PCC13-62-like n=1 Tax=Arachis ipaensis TaxID=130454 RepID=UPI000A2B405D|nr:desiccation-related protein PCC13-62-like [Arachis ipaensis]